MRKWERMRQGKINKKTFVSPTQKELQFESLSMTKAKVLFKKFVKKWNTKKLAKVKC